jgi:hypothetical protein
MPQNADPHSFAALNSRIGRLEAELKGLRARVARVEVKDAPPKPRRSRPRVSHFLDRGFDRGELG